MSKVTYIIKASNDVLNEKTASILIQVIKNNYITSAEIRDLLSETMNASSVNSNIGVLLKKGLIEKSEDGLIATGEAMDIIQAAAVLHAEENKPELLQKRKTRSARGVTEEMSKMAEEVKTLLEARVDVKGIIENRSNLEVQLVKRTNGVRQIEIRRDGSLRIFGYNMSETESKVFTSLSADVKFKVGGKNTYIDFPNITSEMASTIANVF